jgi:hypothetical protein
LIVEYKPSSQEAIESVDLNTNVAMSAAKDGATGSYFTVNSATAHGEVQMPIAAPLTFPDLEYTTVAQKENAFKKTVNFIEDYSDRRAQAVFVRLPLSCPSDCLDVSSTNNDKNRLRKTQTRASTSARHQSNSLHDGPTLTIPSTRVALLGF